MYKITPQNLTKPPLRNPPFWGAAEPMIWEFICLRTPFKQQLRNDFPVLLVEGYRSDPPPFVLNSKFLKNYKELQER